MKASLLDRRSVQWLLIAIEAGNILVIAAGLLLSALGIVVVFGTRHPKAIVTVVILYALLLSSKSRRAPKALQECCAPLEWLLGTILLIEIVLITTGGFDLAVAFPDYLLRHKMGTAVAAAICLIVGALRQHARLREKAKADHEWLETKRALNL